MASCLLVILLHAIACGAATPSNYFMRVWQTDDGLPENGVNAIVQTGDGYLWIGTFSGLVRFDGVRFAIFDIKNSPAMLSDRVTSLFEDDSGNLWIGYETGGLTRYHNGMFQSTETPAWKGRKILAIGEDLSGGRHGCESFLWLGAARGRFPISG